MSDPRLPGIDRALVVGLGRSGVAAATALADAGVLVVAADSRSDVDVSALEDRVELRLGADDEATSDLLADVAVLVPSPGVPEHAPVIRRAIADGIQIWSEPELGYRLAPRDLIGVTGTNGKTTVTELTAAMLDGYERTVVACGNIGNAFTSAAVASPADALLVAELSSFQLRFARTLRPVVGVLLNLAPDHLDWHRDLDAYAAAKAQLWSAQGADDWAVGNADDAAAGELVRRHAGDRVAWFSAHRAPEIGVGVRDGSLVGALPSFSGSLVEVEELQLIAAHHIANVAAAATAALLVGGDPGSVAAGARAYRPGRHRFELVAEVSGVSFIDDSKATNPHAAVAALRSAEHATGRIVWIAGGLAKGLDLGPLGDALGDVRHAVLIGTAAEELAELVSACGVPTSRAATMEDAVRTAAAHAEPGDTVLLAPACASFDQFVDYADRGDRFAAAVRSLDRAAADPTRGVTGG